MFEEFCSTFDKSEAVCAILIGLSKAFESVHRKILISKLECYKGKMSLLLRSCFITCEIVGVGVQKECLRTLLLLHFL